MVAMARHPVLRDINLKIPAGSTLAIVGPTGSGKTTPRPRLGRATLGGTRRRSSLSTGVPSVNGRLTLWPPFHRLRSARQLICSAKTVGGNIAFGLPNYDLNQVRQAAEKSPALDSDVRRVHQ